MGEPDHSLLDRLIGLVSEKSPSVKDAAFPYVGLEHLASGRPVLLGAAGSSDSISINNSFRRGDVLFGKLRPRLRKCVRAPFDGYCSTDILVLRATQDSDPAYASFIMQSEEVFAGAIRKEEGTKMPRCSWQNVRTIQVFCPDVPEQRRIAEILSTVDEAIEQTEALIAKLQQVKTGLMHDLFTRGVTPDGQLRPPREEAPQLYKESELGWIPREWSIRAARTLCSLITKGTTPAENALSTDIGTVRFIRVDNLTFDGSLDLSLPPIFVDPRVHNEALRRSRLRPGDVLTNIVGPPLGKVAIVPSAPHEWNANQAVAIYRPSGVSSDYLAFWLLSRRAQRWLLMQSKQTSGQVNLTLQMCGDLPVPLAPAYEQATLLAQVSALDESLTEERALAQFLRSQKAGMVSDLLTGRVRVPLPDSDSKGAPAADV